MAPADRPYEGSRPSPIVPGRLDVVATAPQMPRVAGGRRARPAKSQAERTSAHNFHAGALSRSGAFTFEDTLALRRVAQSVVARGGQDQDPFSDSQFEVPHSRLERTR